MGRARVSIICVAVALACFLGYACLDKRPKWPPEPVSLSIGSAIISEDDLRRAKADLDKAEIVIEPDSALVQPYQKIHYRVRLNIPDGDEPPHFLYAVLRTRGLFHWRGPLRLKGRNGTEYDLEAVTRAPAKPGTYQLSLEGEYSVKTVGADQADTPSRPWRTVEHKVNGPDIRVRR